MFLASSQTLCSVLFLWVSFYASNSTLFGHIWAIGSPNRISWVTNKWSTISPQGTDYLSHMISESADERQTRLNLRPLNYKSVVSIPIELMWRTSNFFIFINLNMYIRYKKCVMGNTGNIFLSLTILL